ncbi:Transcriptional regulatory protein BtsR [compost metagenome]
MHKIKVLIVDDERAARLELRHAMIKYPEMEIIGEAANADQAQELIIAKQPDLIFLDIQMPERSGFELLEALAQVPSVIFVTAFDQYALQAFEFNAFDYLLKPFKTERFEKAMAKFQQQYQQEKVNKRLFIRDGRHYHFVNLNDIRLIESMDNYARLYFKEKNTFLKTSLNLLEDKLDKNLFFRANRNQIFNINFIQETIALPGGKLKIHLTTGEQVELSERQSVHFKQQHKYP